MAATRTRVHSRALQIIDKIKAGESDELNDRRFRRLAGMLGNEQLAWRVLEDYGKTSIVSDARERLAEANRSRRNPNPKGGDA